MPASTRRRVRVVSRVGNQTLEGLEGRTLLGGDIPGLPTPFTGMVGQAIALNSTTGEGEFTSEIDQAGDDDLFILSVSAGDFVTVLADTPNPVSLLNSAVRVYDSSGTLVSTGNDNGRPTGAGTAVAPDGWVGFVASAGVYYIQVIGQNNSTGEYTLRVDTKSTVVAPSDINADTGQLSVDSDPNISGLESYVIGDITRTQGDIIFKVTSRLEANFASLYTATLRHNDNENYTDPADPFDGRLEIFSGTGARLTTDSDRGYLTSAFTVWAGDPGDVFYIRVRSDQLVGDPATGEFQLHIDFSAEDMEEPVDPVTRRGQDENGVFTTPYQSKTLRFTAEGTGGRTFLTSRRLNPSPAADLGLTLYAEDGTFLFFDDDFPQGGRDPQIEIQTGGGEEYFVVIEAFDPNNGTNPFAPATFGLYVEAHSNTDSNGQEGSGQTVDDHVDLPTTLTSVELIRREMNKATPLKLNDRFLYTDHNGNPVMDRQWSVTGSGTGRVYGPGDTDVFSFVPPTDMLGAYPGSNDDAGTSLFLGGLFTIGDDGALNNVTNPEDNAVNVGDKADYRVHSRNVIGFDGGDFFYVGAQKEELNDNYIFGFNDNPTTVDTNGPVVHAMYKWTDPNVTEQQILIVGGDFDLALTNGSVVRNLAAWVFNPVTGIWDWYNIGSADGPVYAISSLDPEAFDPDGDGPQEEIPDPGAGRLYVGGDYTQIGGFVNPTSQTYVGGTATNNLAEFTPARLVPDGPFFVDPDFRLVLGGWSGIAGINDTVYALTTFDPEDAGDARDAQAGPPAVPAVADAPDAPLSLFIGGAFTGGVTSYNGQYIVDLDDHGRSGGGATPPSLAITGTVYAFQTITLPADTLREGEAETQLYIGGDFTANAVTGTATNLVRYGRIASNDDPFADPFADDQQAAFATYHIYEAVDGPTLNNDVLALAAYPNFDQEGNRDGDLLLVGGRFTNTVSPRLAATNGQQWAPVGGTILNGEVRTIAVFADSQEPNAFESDIVGEDFSQMIHIGGTFTQAVVDGEIADVTYAARLDGDGQWRELNSGINGVVNTMIEFDDNNPLAWDRNDRTASRLRITLNPTTDSFLNAFVQVYNSNFELIWANDSITGTGDPAGSNDQSLAPNLPSVGPTVWAGETYYVVVSSATGQFRNTGRYTLDVTMDAIPPDVDGDGEYDDTVSTLSDTTDAGNWSSAVPIVFDDTLFGDVVKYTDVRSQQDITQELPFSPASGTVTRRFGYPRVPTDPIGSTPSRFWTTQGSSIDRIDEIDDTDLFFFQANNTGFIEIRLNTTNLRGSFYERIWDLNPRLQQQPATAENREDPDHEDPYLYDSNFDGAIRIFDNDFNEVGYNDNNAAVTGEFNTDYVGVDGPSSTTVFKTFYHRDPRLVIPVIAGETYYIQIESGQNVIFNDPDRGEDFVDWRHAIGAYELSINSAFDFDTDSEDDYGNGAVNATPLVIGQDPEDPDTNGKGGVTGRLADTTFNPTDVDSFFFYTVAKGLTNVTMRATSASLTPILTVRDINGNEIGTATGTAGGEVNVVFTAVQGEMYFLYAQHADETSGEYEITIDGQPYSDDHASLGDWGGATPLTLNAAEGTAPASGELEEASDSDIFVFTAQAYEIASVTLTSLDNTLRPFVQVYEINRDSAENPVFVQLDYQAAANAGGATSAVFSTTPGLSYYIVVTGEDRDADFGRYNLVVNVEPTDDHPDLPAPFPATAPNSTRITMNDNAGDQTSTGSATGEVEINSDTDLFRFTSTYGGAVAITVTTPSSNFAPRVRLVSLTGTVLANVDGTAGTATLNFTGLAAGTDYFVVVSPGATGASETSDIGTYSVAIATTPTDDHPNAGQFAQASVITLTEATGNGNRTGFILPTGDGDLFRFTTLAAGQTILQIATPGSNFAPKLTLFNSAFQVIPGAVSVGFDSAQQTINAGAAGEVYYILVEADTSAASDRRVGGYTVSVDGIGLGGTGADDHADEGEWGTASTISLDAITGNGSRAGVINAIDDTDLFTFTTMTAGKLNLQVTTPTGGLTDGSIRVFDAFFNEVAFDAAGMPGTTASLTITSINGQLPQAGTYYVLVEGVNNGTGAYTVRVDSEPELHHLYFPEGFAGATIDEFIPMVNPNDFAVTYQIYAHYETGERDQLIATGTIAPGARDGITIVSRGRLSEALVRPGVGYALEIVTDGQIGATFSHYDFSVSVGESFTSETSTTWTFAEVHKDPGVFSDFVLYYNPNNVDANLTITVYYEDGTTATFNRTVPSQRRKGINVNTDGAIPTEGVFGMKITSDVPIVASLTSYNLTNGGGDGLLGDPTGGSLEGVIPSLSTGSGVESSIGFLNSSNSTATVTVRASYSRVDLPDLVRTIVIPAGRVVTFTGATLGLVDSELAGIRYTSDVPVTVAAMQYKNGDGDAVAAATSAATQWIIGDAFINPTFAGTKYMEDVALYNPTGSAAEITINFLFVDGTSQSTTVMVGADDFAFVSIDQQPIILNMGRPRAFSILMESDMPFVAAFSHYDLFLNGGWGTIAAPVGLTNDLNTI